MWSLRKIIVALCMLTPLPDLIRLGHMFRLEYTQALVATW